MPSPICLEDASAGLQVDGSPSEAQAVELASPFKDAADEICGGNDNPARNIKPPLQPVCLSPSQLFAGCVDPGLPALAPGAALPAALTSAPSLPPLPAPSGVSMHEAPKRHQGRPWKWLAPSVAVPRRADLTCS